MFSGIVEETGRVRRISKQGRSYSLSVEASKVRQGAGIGDSIAVNGVCLTVVGNNGDTLDFEVTNETFSKTDLSLVHPGQDVNLESSLKAGDRIGGHFVTGHIDCMGVIRRKSYIKDDLCFEIAIEPAFMKYIIPKGSVSLDGISLTIAQKRSSVFRVYIIRHTLENTVLKNKSASDRVNVEFDILAKSALEGVRPGQRAAGRIP